MYMIKKDGLGGAKEKDAVIKLNAFFFFYCHIFIQSTTWYQTFDFGTE